MNIFNGFGFKNNADAFEVVRGAASSGKAIVSSRRVRVFISSTFRDMIEERDNLMTHTWPELRRICHERQVELVEVDLRWGIAESQSTRKETLKLCLDEIRACRPFFIGLLGERYGWTPGEDAFTADLKEEQAWLKGLHGKSVTELEILHGVLMNPDMAKRAFFYFRDPDYAQSRGPDFFSDSKADADKQTALKMQIRTACEAKQIPLREKYPDPKQLAAFVLEDLKAAIEVEFPKEDIPDPLTREAQDHEAFAETRRRTYIGRADYFEALDRHAVGNGGPLLLLGDSGSGKSALLANWVARWREKHPKDFIVQHYIGGTTDSADHWRLMTRVMAEIKRWTNDPEEPPTKRGDILKDFPLWLAKAKAKPAHEGERFILVLDALNQLDDQDHARLLGWLPEHMFSGPLRLIASTLPETSGADDPRVAARNRHWQEWHVLPLTVDERRQMIADYLARFGKKLDDHRLNRLASAAPAANPLYLKILIDDLRVTGTYEHLDERISNYLKAQDISALLQQVITRYQRDYELDRKDLVAETLSLIYAARRGLSEKELLQLMRPADQSQLPPALWTPLRAALDDSLVDRNGILNFAHDFFRSAVRNTFVLNESSLKAIRLCLAKFFDSLPPADRTCDELPWLLQKTESREQLRAFLLNLDDFVLLHKRDEVEPLAYWIWLGDQATMGNAYANQCEQLCSGKDELNCRGVHGAILARVAYFLDDAGFYGESNSLIQKALPMLEEKAGPEHPHVTMCLNNLGLTLLHQGHFKEAEKRIRAVLEIRRRKYGDGHRDTLTCSNNLGMCLYYKGDFDAACRILTETMNRRRRILGEKQPHTLLSKGNLAAALAALGDYARSIDMCRDALEGQTEILGPLHPDTLRTKSNLAACLHRQGRLVEAKNLCRQAVDGRTAVLGSHNPDTLVSKNILGAILADLGLHTDAECCYREVVSIQEQTIGTNHLDTLATMNNLACLLYGKGSLAEAEPWARKALCGLLSISRESGISHPQLAQTINAYGSLLHEMHYCNAAIIAKLRELGVEF